MRVGSRSMLVCTYVFAFTRKLEPKFVFEFEGALFALQLRRTSLPLFALPPKKPAVRPTTERVYSA